MAKANKKTAKKRAAKQPAKKANKGAKKATKKKAAAKPAAKKAAPTKQAAAAKKPAAKKPAAKQPASEGAGKTIAGYTAKFADWRGDVLERIRGLIAAAAPGAKASIKWAQPVFEHNGPFAFIRAHTKHVNLGFWRGKELDDPDGRLESGGDRMAHVKIGGIDDIDESRFAAWVRQAVALNDEKGNPTKRG